MCQGCSRVILVNLRIELWKNKIRIELKSQVTRGVMPGFRFELKKLVILKYLIGLNMVKGSPRRGAST